MSDEFINDDARREAARRRLEARQSQRGETRSIGRTHQSQRTQDQRPQSNRQISSRQAQQRPQAVQQSRKPQQQKPRQRSAQQPRSLQQRSSQQRRSAGQRSVQSSSRSQQITGVLANIGSTVVNVLKNAGAFCTNAYNDSIERHGKRNTYIRIAIAVVVVIALIFVIRACTTPIDPAEQDLNKAVEAVNTASYTNDDGATPNQATLANLLGAEDAATLLNTASTNEDAYWVAAHPDSFTVDGTAVQGKLMRLAGNEPEAASFVRNWPDEYPQEKASGDASTPSAESTTNVPRLYQWDKRWGYTVYSSTSFALTGCCPTAMAMVYQGLTGKTDMSPYDMGVLATKGGYETEYNGTDTAFLFSAAEQLGLTCTQLTPMASNLTAPLSAGQILIINVGPGDFTTSGHFIVACGLDSDGKVIINDPYSAVRSSQTWDVSTLVSQAKMFYAFTVA